MGTISKVLMLVVVLFTTARCSAAHTPRDPVPPALQNTDQPGRSEDAEGHTSRDPVPSASPSTNHARHPEDAPGLKPRYPVPPAYPTAENVRRSEDSTGGMRITTFETNDSPEAVLDYYQKTLREQGWKVRSTSATGMSLDYPGHQNGPAFSLGVVIIDTQEGTTTVEVRQVISGPFTWFDGRTDAWIDGWNAEWNPE